MYREADLKSVGRSAAEEIGRRKEWIHRRVETVSFPSPHERIYRRQVSIDFSIPNLKPVPHRVTAGRDSDRATDRAEGDVGQGDRYYVPLSYLRKWPPLLRLDLRNAADQPVPLLTRKQNETLDAELLLALAAHVLDGEIEDEDLRKQLNILATTRDKDDASRALLSVMPPSALGSPAPERKRLREHPHFREVAGALRDNTLLWLRVEGQPGDREMVKFSYDIPMRQLVRGRSMAAFGLRAFKVRFETPHIGGAGSYHLNISAPAPLQVPDARIVINDPRTAEGHPEEDRVVAVCDATRREAREVLAQGPLELYAHRVGRQARFYVHGDRAGSRGEAWVALLAEKSGFVTGAATAAVGTAALLGLFAFRLGTVLDQVEAAVALLLLAPALLAYLVVRPGEHALVGQFLTGLRRLLLGVAALPLVGAAMIVGAGGEKTDTLCAAFAVLFGLACLGAVGLTAGAIFPLGKHRRPLTVAEASEGSSSADAADAT